MSQFNGDTPDAGAPNPAMMVARRRPASVNLREQSDGGVGAMMDPANQSLADALKITYRLLQLGMVALVVIFLLSGFQSIKNYEKGVRVTFGQVDAGELDPGFRFSWPRPLGEIIRVPTGNESVDLRREFFPNLPPDQVNKTLQELANSGRGELKPEQDGYVVTRDLGVAHGRFTATWRRTNIRSNVQNIRADQELKLVQTAVMRGVVHASAQLSLGEFLYGTPEGDRTGTLPDATQLIQARANQTLEEMGAGIEVTNLTIQDRTPPLLLITEFNNVQTQQQKSQTEIEVARRTATETLSGAAGEATEALLGQIAEYDAALATGDDAKAEAILAVIDAVLEGRETVINGQKMTLRASGAAGQAIVEAQQYRSTVVSKAQGEAEAFAARLQAFKTNPGVVLVSDWTDAYRALLARPEFELWMLPPGVSTIQLLLNRDPEVVRNREQLRFKSDQEELERGRLKQLQDQQLKKFQDTSAPVDAR